MNKVSCEIFLAINEDGDWIVTTDESEALSKLAEDQGGYQGRVVKIVAKMAPPALIETTIDVPDEAGTTAELSTD